MDPGDQSVSLEHFSTWKVEALRDFLTKRGLSKDGNKSELAALCFSAHVMKLPLVPSASDILQQNAADYKHLLTFESTSIPDPLTLYKDWLDEKCGIVKWPPIYLSDIIAYLHDKSSNSFNIKAVLQDYKVGKAYEYYHNGFLQEVFYHQIQNASQYCILRSRCTPSMCFKDGHHNLWVVANKESGDIKSAYCSCTAGLGGTCSHIAALLFRIEAANKQGLTSCTSVSCVWTIPPRSKEIVPSKIKDLNIEKSRHGQSDSKRPLVSGAKKEFHPVNNIKVNPCDFTDVLKKSLPNACVFKGLPSYNGMPQSGQLPPANQTEAPLNNGMPHSGQLPPANQTEAPLGNGMPHSGQLPFANQTEAPLHKQPLYNQSKQDSQTSSLSKYTMVCMLEKCKSTDILDVMNAMSIVSEEEQDKIQVSTIGQHKCKMWHDIREGRITSSSFYTIHTKVKSYRNQKSADFSPNIARVMGYERINPNIRSLKHGREMEPVAKSSFISYISDKNCKHVDVQVTECGVFIDVKHPYLAASPDLLINCSCCGKGVVEIKCPLIPKCKSCTDFCMCNLPSYLSKENCSLKKNHSYYAQIQGQLAITGRNYCDFFVYTCNGSLHQRILFDENYYLEVLDSLIYFFLNHVVPEHFSRKLQVAYQKNTEKCTDTTEEIAMDAETTFFCPVCNQVIENQSRVLNSKDQSICCDHCELWYHFKCVNISKQLALKLKNWSCPNCSDD